MTRPSCARLAAGAALLVVSACAGLQRPLDKTARPDPTQAYVAGHYESVDSVFGFALLDAQDNEYRITFREDRPASGIMGSEPQTGAVGLTPLPPGDYRVSGWIIGAGSQPISAYTRLGRPFHVDAGQVVFIGTFNASKRIWSDATTIHTEWSLDPLPIRADEVVTVVRTAYPAFAEAPIECILCVAPDKGATAFATPAAGATPLFGKRSIVLHYRRHKAYDGWGLHAWETFQKPEDVLSPGDGAQRRRVLTHVTWERPLAPDGKDDFGVYWKLADANFRNGRVNFLIHSLSTTEFEGRFWLVDQSPEAWVNEDDPKVYLSREAADGAWK